MVMESPCSTKRVHDGHEGHEGSMKAMGVHELQGGFDEVLVGFMEGLEIKERSIRVIKVMSVQYKISRRVCSARVLNGYADLGGLRIFGRVWESSGQTRRGQESLGGGGPGQSKRVI